ncbi:MAG: hypothetical protein Q9195_008099 [Heterodermia aff. obscurata]
MTALTSHTITYADGAKKIHHLAAGPPNGPLILFIHGWPGTAITWQTQLSTFASLGFRALAPDMPGYGQSTARRVAEDYSQEALVAGMLALLASTGRRAAIWVGHDWGAGVTSSVARQHPLAVKALINLCVPYHTIELGWDGFLPLVNRDIYPKEEFEFGQWDYMRNWEEKFEETIAWCDLDPAGLCKAFLQPTKAPATRVAPLGLVRKNGWMGGAPRPPGVDASGPTILPAEVFDSFAEDMQKTGFWPGTAYYLNHERNKVYHAKAESGGKLELPVLFVHATWDTVCDTKTSRLVEPMREVCGNLTEVTVEAGHWVQFEKPGEVNAALIRFIVEELPSEWPGFWDGGYTKKKSVL